MRGKEVRRGKEGSREGRRRRAGRREEEREEGSREEREGKEKRGRERRGEGIMRGAQSSRRRTMVMRRISCGWK